MTALQWSRMLDVMLTGVFHVTSLCAPYMRTLKWGRIVNIGSVFGIVSKEYRAPYSASKFALDGMTAALAAEVAAVVAAAGRIGINGVKLVK
jgi:3-oxoacyl-[acyl-carrier protein] reductase